jgi:UDP-2-acetamido-3-amino-2,3-dideoxy-glucuronate N-acetyltransferase
MCNIYKTTYKLVCEDRSAIHSSVKFGENVRIGEDVVIDENVIIGNNVFIGHNTVIRNNVKIGNDTVIGHLVVIESNTTIGNYVTIQSQCHITKFAEISDNVFFGPKAMCINTYHISHGRNFEPKMEGPKIGYGCRIGAGSVIMPGVVLGREVEIGANSTVTKDCDAFCVYMGSPAKKNRSIHTSEIYEM